jgi:TPR repeat protein
MMAPMRQGPWLLALLLLAALPSAASAQFYDLDGAYRCLTKPTADCENDLREQKRPPPPKPVGPTLEQVIAKVRDHTAGAREIAILEKDAATDDPRAVEVLAWCKLNGIGTPADALAAFWLYQRAAQLGVAHARQNQVAIYETRLTPQQREQVLLRENKK